MEFDNRMDFAAEQLAAATLAQIESDRERLRKLWISLNEAEFGVRRGQLPYLESTELLTRANATGTSDEPSLAPLVAIDLIIRNARSEVLLGLRQRAGQKLLLRSRITKNERLAEASARIVKNETGRGQVRRRGAARRVRALL